jgi:hypothetical protein
MIYRNRIGGEMIRIATIIILSSLFLLNACSESTVDCSTHGSEIFVIDSIFPEMTRIECATSDYRISATCRIVYHYRFQAGGIIETGIYFPGGSKVTSYNPDYMEPISPWERTELILEHNGGCSSLVTDQDSMNMYLRIESIFWKKGWGDQRYIWSDTIRVEVQR